MNADVELDDDLTPYYVGTHCEAISMEEKD